MIPHKNITQLLLQYSTRYLSVPGRYAIGIRVKIALGERMSPQKSEPLLKGLE